MALGATLQPFYGSAGIYSTTGNFYEGLTTPAFNASLGMWILAWASSSASSPSMIYPINR